LKFFYPDEVLPAAGERARILRKRLVLDSIMVVRAVVGPEQKPDPARVALQRTSS
jgi:hypothetical protein